MATKFPECESCYFHHREPAICEECDEGSEYVPEDNDEDYETNARRTIPIKEIA